MTPEGEYGRTLRPYRNGNLELSGERSVTRRIAETVVQQNNLPSAEREDRFDVEYHTRDDRFAGSGTARVGNRRGFVEAASYPVTGELAHDRASGARSLARDRIAYVTDPVPRHRGPRAGQRRTPGSAKQPACLRPQRRYAECPRGIGHPAVTASRDVQGNHVALAQDVAGGDTVRRDIVHRCTDRPGEPLVAVHLAFQAVARERQRRNLIESAVPEELAPLGTEGHLLQRVWGKDPYEQVRAAVEAGLGRGEYELVGVE